MAISSENDPFVISNNSKFIEFLFLVKRCCCAVLSDTFFTYSTVKVVQVPHTLIAIIYRIIQLIIICYIALYIVWIKKGYQQFQEPRGTSVIKVKGIAKVTDNETTRFVHAESAFLWDTAEYQIPPLENNALFIATRQVVTYGQTEGQCPSALQDGLFCNQSSLVSCLAGQPTPNTFGYFTGACVPSLQNASINVCQISAWCPEELSQSTEFLMDSNDVENFTIYLKTLVTFTLFDINLRNVRDDTNFTCRYHKVNDPRCPIFRIGDILDSLKTNKSALLREGGLIEIRQDWTCNFDFHRDYCFPKIEFSVLQTGDDKQSPGINYRSAQKYRVNDTDYRTLSKIYGLRFVVAISGKGGQFNIVDLFVAIGSGIGFMVIADILCDAIFMYFHKYRERYREGKFSVCVMSSQQEASAENLRSIGSIQTQEKRPITADTHINRETF
ncbi:unnamed protein product [Rotaria sp. Silwood2]|nr:unnamed protein product [Rotaria sp. Silwood2]CAF3055765.1 unnamed protein product [Rotaria sp. Silwood2]CAF3849024.1 unnamed protein product [Rotaria sp. Silwood2]CAF4044394.1 unnamed protein product [Rotaria sp. Silwood2]